MPKKSLNWSPEVLQNFIQEEELLIQLKEKQTAIDKKNWKIIANIINQKFLTMKTAKQCRERYINNLKFRKSKETDFDWSESQMN